MNEGWIKLHRVLLDHPRSNNPNWMSLWLHLLMLATHKPIRMVFAGKVIDLKPGQFITSRQSLSLQTGILRSTLERILGTMISEQQIEQQTSNASRLITILNWDKYQQTEQRSEQQVSNDRATGEQQVSTNKNVKKDKNERISTDVFTLTSDEPAPKPKSRGTLEEVLSHAQHIGLDEDDGRWFFEKCEGCGWKNGRVAIQDYKMTMSSWKRQGYYPSQRHSKNGHADPKRPPTITELRTVMEVKQSKANGLKNLFASEGPLSTEWRDESKRKEYVQLKKEIQEINDKISKSI